MILKAAPPQPLFYNVFLSYAPSDRTTAEVLQQKLAEAGLTVFDAARLPSGEDAEAVLRQAMWESAALVVVGTPPHLVSPQLLFEIGAAWGLNKPVFVLWNSAYPAEIPAFMRQFRVQPLAETDSVVRELVELSQPLSDRDLQALVQVYERLGVSADRLQTDPAAADRLARDFRRATESSTSPEVLLRELLRLRKRGLLPRVKKTSR